MALTQISTQGIKDGTITGSDLATNVDLVDNQKLRLGTGNDLQIYHDGTNSRIHSSSHNLYIRTGGIFGVFNGAGSETMLKATVDGAVELYHDNSKKFETTSAGATITGALSTTSLSATGGITGTGGNFILGDSSGTSNDRIKLGASQDLELFHNGTNSFILSNSHPLILESDSLILRSDANEKYFEGTSNGAVELYHNNSKKFETTSYGNLSAAQVRVASSNASTVAFSVGDVGTGFYNSGSNAIGYSANGTQKWQINSAGDLNLADNVKGIFGDGLDLQIFHNGSHSEIADSGTGDLRILTSKLKVLNNPASADELMIQATENGAVELYHNGTKRLETTANGVEIANALFVGEKIDMPDHTSGTNGMILLGTGDDLFMYHDGTNSHLRNNTGTFNIRATNFRLTDVAIQHVYLKTNDSGNNDIQLYYDNNVKLQTSTSGVAITGEAALTGGALKLDSHPLVSIANFTDISGGSYAARLGSTGSSTIRSTQIYGGGGHIATFDGVNIRLGINETAPDYMLHLTGTIPAICLEDTTGTHGQSIIEQNDDNLKIRCDAGNASSGTDSNIRLEVDGGERIRVKSDGSFCIGTTGNVTASTGGATFSSASDGRKKLMLGVTVASGRGLVNFFNSNGEVGGINTDGSGTQYLTSSDYRLKENVVPISDGIARLKTLKPSRFNFIADANTTVDGFLAHEVTAVPEAITGTKDELVTQSLIDSGDKDQSELGNPVYQSIDQSKLVPLVVAALQEAIAKIHVLETEVAALKAS